MNKVLQVPKILIKGNNSNSCTIDLECWWLIPSMLNFMFPLMHMLFPII